MKRRELIGAMALGLVVVRPLRADIQGRYVTFAQPQPGVALSFPRDHGAHPDFRTEWWYVTGWLDEGGGAPPCGFQVTFFRSKLDTDPADPSRFAPRQILFAHAALSDGATQRTWHGQQAARVGFGLANAATEDAHVQIDAWVFRRDASSGAFLTHIETPQFSYDLSFAPTQPLLLEGDAGFSQKGPLAGEASRYYSAPQLAVSGQITRQETRGPATTRVTGRAWLDREWSSSYLDARARGWDWIGINFDDGGALMAFAIRDLANQPFWAGATLRAADGTTTRYGPGDVAFVGARSWTSPRTRVVYPVAQKIRCGPYEFTVEPLFDDQELDGSASTGTIYWEGAVRAAASASAPWAAGRGYLELTGYDRPLKL